MLFLFHAINVFKFLQDLKEAYGLCLTMSKLDFCV